MKKPNEMIFKLVDNTRLDAYNESCEMKKQWYGDISEGQTIDIETYYTMCKEFAKAMGFAEATVEEWFGTY